jgi:hypothetical protein
MIMDKLSFWTIVFYLIIGVSLGVGGLIGWALGLPWYGIIGCVLATFLVEIVAFVLWIYSTRSWT